jgi:membrane protease YdiL (CAAX protease family)
MLVAGLHGDGEPSRRELELQPRRMSRKRLRELAERVPVRIPSLRLVPDRRRAASLRSLADAAGGLKWLVPLLMVSMLGLPWVIDHLWLRVAAINAVAALLAYFAVRIDHLRLWRFDPMLAFVGLGLGLVMFGVSRAVLAVLEVATPDFLAAGESFIGWAATFPAAAGIPALVAIAALEDAVWRGAVTLPLAGKYGAWRASAIAGALFGLAHLTSGPLILVFAAIVAGFVWSAIAIRTRSLTATVTCHVVWDLLTISTGL